MATRLYFRLAATAKTGVVDVVSQDMIPAISNAVKQLRAAVTSGNSAPVQGENQPTPIGTVGWYSERVASEVNLSGTVTCNVWLAAGVATGSDAWVRLSKITAGGSDVETPLCEFRTTPSIGATYLVYNLTAVMPADVTVAENERIIARFYAIPTSGSYTGTGGVNIQYSNTALNKAESWIEFPQTLTFKGNQTRLWLRRTTDTGIGTFYDMLTAQGPSAATTGVVNTAASGTNIQWTRTAGGTLLEWISPRIKKGFMWDTASQAIDQMWVWAKESNLSANCAVRFRLYRWRGGVETEIWNVPGTAELTTTSTNTAVSRITAGSTVTAASFAPDDRVVFRAFIMNVGTMAAGFTCTITYDHNTGTGLTDGNSYVHLFPEMDFKAESDPAEPPTPSRVTMGGVGS